MVEKLIGVEHGRALIVNGTPVFHSVLTPGQELLSELRSLPQGASVGIEHSPEFGSKIQVDGVPIETPGTKDYWRIIQRVCEESGLEVAYLEDFPTYERYIRKVMEREVFRQEILQRFKDFKKAYPNKTDQEFDNSEEIVPLFAGLHEAETERDYIFYIERENEIFDGIARNDPKVVIIGNRHAGYAMIKPEEMLSRGVLVGEHFTEERFEVPWHWSDEAHEELGKPHLKSATKPDDNPILFRELLRRKYRAVKHGRVVLDGREPNFVGSWDLRVLSSGLFEIFLDDKTSGVIEDTLGTATLTGAFNKNGFRFLKSYIPESSASGVKSDPIRYEGLRIGNAFWGDYLGPKQRDEFILMPYAEYVANGNRFP